MNPAGKMWAEKRSKPPRSVASDLRLICWIGAILDGIFAHLAF